MSYLWQFSSHQPFALWLHMLRSLENLDSLINDIDDMLSLLPFNHFGCNDQLSRLMIPLGSLFGFDKNLIVKIITTFVYLFIRIWRYKECANQSIFCYTLYCIRVGVLKLMTRRIWNSLHKHQLVFNFWYYRCLNFELVSIFMQNQLWISYGCSFISLVVGAKSA